MTFRCFLEPFLEAFLTKVRKRESVFRLRRREPIAYAGLQNMAMSDALGEPFSRALGGRAFRPDFGAFGTPRVHSGTPFCGPGATFCTFESELKKT